MRLRWLWFEWTKLERPWNGMALPVDSVDLTLFNAATHITIYNGIRHPFGTPTRLMARHLQNYSQPSMATTGGSTEL